MLRVNVIDEDGVEVPDAEVGMKRGKRIVTTSAGEGACGRPAELLF